jgi:hypothetical protein
MITRENEFSGADMIVTEGYLIGTHTGTFRSRQGDVPASGNRVSLRYASVRMVRDGKIAWEHLYFDQLEFLQQIGAIPSRGPQ